MASSADLVDDVDYSTEVRNVFALADGRDRALMEDPGGEKCRPWEFAGMEGSSLAVLTRLVWCHGGFHRVLVRCSNKVKACVRRGGREVELELEVAW